MVSYAVVCDVVLAHYLVFPCVLPVLDNHANPPPVIHEPQASKQCDRVNFSVSVFVKCSAPFANQGDALRCPNPPSA
eukprot:94543-Rhodomonas_salina.5